MMETSARTSEFSPRRRGYVNVKSVQFENKDGEVMKKNYSANSLAMESSTGSASITSSSSADFTLASSYEVEQKPIPLSSMRPEGAAMRRAMKKKRRIDPTSPEFYERLNRIWAKEDQRLKEPETSNARLFWKLVFFVVRVVEISFSFLFWPVLLVFGSKNKNQVAGRDIPVERRKQSVALVMYYLLFLCLPLAHFVGLFFVIFPLTTFPMLCYLFYIWKWDTRHEDGSTIPRARYWSLWRWLCSYFPLRLIKTCNLDPRGKYVFAYHPHGIISFGAFGNFATNGTGFSRMFPGIDLRLLTLNMSFYSPFLRELMLSLGLCCASQKSCQNILGSGKSIMIVVGGAAESLEAEPHTYRLTLQRKGFVRQAFIGGADLVPVIGFGENDIYDTKYLAPNSFARKFQETLRKYVGFATPVFWGRGIYGKNIGIFPHRRPIFTVVGKPVRLPRLPPQCRNNNWLCTDPQGIELVNEYHEHYVQSLRELWDTYKHKLAVDRTGTLQVVK